MARGLMEVINISPGQPVYVEDYRMSDLGLEWNVQNELDYRIEYLMTNRVVMEEISSETLWGLSGWTSANSLKITQSAGVLQCDVGMADIGGRRYVRTGSGAITPTGVSTDDVDYWIRAKYDTSADTHSFVAELASAAPQSDTDTDKRVTLATAHWLSPNWTGTPVDKRTSNTQLTPPAVISGNAGSSPVLSLHQDGSGLGLLVTGGDVSVGDATYNQQLIVYGTSTYGVTIYDDPGGFSVEMIAGDNTLKVQTVGDGDATINVATLDIVSGPNITSTGIDMNSGTITDAGTINGISITTGTITSGIWQGTDVAAAYLGAHDHTSVDQGGDYGWADITGGITSDAANGATTTAVSADWAYDHAVGQTEDLHTKVGALASGSITTGFTAIANAQLASFGTSAQLDQNANQASSPTFVGLTLSGPIGTVTNIAMTGSIATPTTITTSGNVTVGGDLQINGGQLKSAGGNIIWDMAGVDVTHHGGIYPNVNKILDIGYSSPAWDEGYADNWNAVSSWKTFADPLAVLKRFKPEADDGYKIDHKSIDDWICARVKCKVKNEDEDLEWEGGYVLKSGKAKAGARTIHDDKLKKNVRVGNYADGYSDEDFEHEEAYSINKTQIILIQAMNQLKDENDSLISKVVALESRIHTLESAS